MRRAFTLIELLVIVGIIASMVTVSVLSVRSGQDAVRMRGAARDVFATIRRARSTALITQKPTVITYSCSEVDGESAIKIEIKSEEIMSTSSGKERVQTLSGAPLPAEAAEDAPVTAESAAAGGPGEEGGESVEEVLFRPIDEEVVRGMRLKVALGDESLDYGGSGSAAGSKVSIFSTADYLSKMYGATSKKKQEDAASSSSGTTEPSAEKGIQEPVSVVWETNGRVEPHRIWIYADGAEPESGLSIKIDRFGAAKILASGEDE